MFELFEFTRLLTVKVNTKLSHLRQGGKIEIIKFAWKEEGEVSFLALLCSNDHILLRYNCVGRSPVLKQLPWLLEKPIAAMCFDPTLTWLMIVTRTTNEIFIVPAASIVNPDAIINQLFKTDDTTLRTFTGTSGYITCALWWQTLDGNQVAIVASNLGDIVFIDLLNGKQVRQLTLSVNVTDLTVSQDDLQFSTSLLITSSACTQWKLLLETRTTFSSYSPDLEVSEMGYDNIDSRSIPPRSILDSIEDDIFLFTPTQIQNFPPPTLLRPQYARGRHFITAHCKLISKLQVLDPDADQNPLFIYKLPVGADNVILTDKLIFTVINHSRDKKLIFLSNQRSENPVDDHQEFDYAAVVQEFNLPPDERLIGVEKKRYPFYFHEHYENEWLKRTRSDSLTLSTNRILELPTSPSVLDIPVATHTVLDGCILVTDSSVYEVKPRISPERLFLHLALTLPETYQAENLAISIGLDLTALSEIAAEYLLKQSNFPKALKLYTLSKCSVTRRTGGLARHGCIAETVAHLRQVLSCSSFELNASERKFLSDLLLHCFVYQMNNSVQSCLNIPTGFSDYLLGSFSLDEQTALNLLSDFGHVDLLLSFAKARGLVIDALSSSIKSESFGLISFSALTDLVQHGFSAHLLQSGLGPMLSCLPPENLATLLLSRPQLAIQNYSQLKPVVSQLKHDQLLDLSRTFDPSKKSMRRILLQLQMSRNRTNSLTSLCSVSSEPADGKFEQTNLSVESLIEFFLLLILNLNHCRRLLSSSQLPQQQVLSLLSNPMDRVQTLQQNSSFNGDTHRKLVVQFQPVSCGPKHSAVIRNGDLYTWGRAQMGRLGHGETTANMVPPARVETLHMLKLRVQAVACGNEHTLALTEQGVYAWGSSKFGQVGVGTRHVYKWPMLIETLQMEETVAVECGHYHSLVLTAHHQVYSWGWGVHGQLGHGHPEDCLVPTHVHRLLTLGVVRVSAGYAHTLALTESGDVWTFGCGYFGQLGVGSNQKSSIPLKIEMPSMTHVVAIGTKYFHSVAVSEDNKVFTWGLHPHNLRQVASSLRASRHTGVYIPEQTAFLYPTPVETNFVHGLITKVSCGSLHTSLLTEDGGLFVWGRNLEGQLGTGSRQDERQPKMLTSINDQHIVAVASGGEFNIAMDSDGSVWVWGKNDSGQLGYLKARKDNHKNYRLPGLNSLRGSTSQSLEINVPLLMKALPPSDTSCPHWIAMLESFHNENLWIENSEAPLSPLDDLPNLDELGDIEYDPCVVPVTLQTLRGWCSPSVCLQQCLDLLDWETAGHINQMEDNIIQALYFRLRSLAEKATSSEMDELVNACATVVEYHIKLINKMSKNQSTEEEKKELQKLCSHALHCWKLFKLPLEKLEVIFTEHLAELAPWLVEVVLRQQSSNDSQPESASALFSITFCLKVLKAAMSADITDSRGLGDTGMAWHQMLDTTNIEEIYLQPRVHLQQQGKLTPRDRLWADILRNMKKDVGPITLTSSQLEHLVEKEQSQTDAHGPLKLVVFTCGHHYTSASFQSEVVDKLASEISQLPHSASLLKRILLQPGLKTSACPKCLLKGIKDI